MLASGLAAAACARPVLGGHIVHVCESLGRVKSTLSHLSRTQCDPACHSTQLVLFVLSAPCESEPTLGFNYCNSLKREPSADGWVPHLLLTANDLNMDACVNQPTRCEQLSRNVCFYEVP